MCIVFCSSVWVRFGPVGRVVFSPANFNNGNANVSNVNRGNLNNDNVNNDNVAVAPATC